jgi:hypothetical protein
MEGTVIRVLREKNCGFIAGEGRSWFFLAGYLIGSRTTKLPFNEDLEGERVTFDAGRDRRNGRVVAVNVRRATETASAT